jgi:hypothetical protein
VEAVRPEVDGLAGDYVSVRIQMDVWMPWVFAANDADITNEGLVGLAELRITRKAREGGATFRVDPQLWQMQDLMCLLVRANGTCLEAGHVEAALKELTQQARISAAMLRPSRWR